MTADQRQPGVDDADDTRPSRLCGFPTESTNRHLDFYWRGTLPILKRFVEER
jgi:hypothetical protein